MQEADGQVETLTTLELERVNLESDLQFIIDNIPHADQSGFRVYADERTHALAETGCPIGDPDHLEGTLHAEYMALPEEQRREHEEAGRVEYNVLMFKARNVLRQRGRRYLDLCERLGVAANSTLMPLIRLLLVPEPEAPAVRYVAPKGGPPQQAKAAGQKRPRESDSGAAQAPGRPAAHSNGAASLFLPPTPALTRPPADLAVRIMCNGFEGVLYPACSKVVYKDREFTAPQFEQFCGAGSTKKWKISLRVVPGSVPECPSGDRPMLVGKWLDMCGYSTGNLRTRTQPKLVKGSSYD